MKRLINSLKITALAILSVFAAACSYACLTMSDAPIASVVMLTGSLG